MNQFNSNKVAFLGFLRVVLYAERRTNDVHRQGSRPTKRVSPTRYHRGCFTSALSHHRPDILLSHARLEARSPPTGTLWCLLMSKAFITTAKHRCKIHSPSLPPHATRPQPANQEPRRSRAPPSRESVRGAKMLRRHLLREPLLSGCVGFIQCRWKKS